MPNQCLSFDKHETNWTDKMIIQITQWNDTVSLLNWKLRFIVIIATRITFNWQYSLWFMIQFVYQRKVIYSYTEYIGQ